jgi:hypothetical protein
LACICAAKKRLATSTIVETYLRSRGVISWPPATICFLLTHQSGHWPAMICACAGAAMICACAGAAKIWLLAVSHGQLADERGPRHVEGAVNSRRFWPCIVP